MNGGSIIKMKKKYIIRICIYCNPGIEEGVAGCGVMAGGTGEEGTL